MILSAISAMYRVMLHASAQKLLLHHKLFLVLSMTSFVETVASLVTSAGNAYLLLYATVVVDEVMLRTNALLPGFMLDHTVGFESSVCGEICSSGHQ